MICFIRRSTVDYDIRLKKYIEACKQTKTPFIAITWDRLMNSTAIENEYQLKSLAPYGSGWKNLWGLIKWLVFMYKNIFVHWRDYRVIHACNLEVYLFVLPLRLLGKKIVFDIYDSVNIKVEHHLARYANLLILPHAKRLEQINLVPADISNLLIIENVPQFTNQVICRHQAQIPNKVRLAYVGVLEPSIRGIENLLSVVAGNPNVELDIAGVGGGLEELVTKYSEDCQWIRYHGKVNYDEALSIMANSDLIVGLYYSFHEPHKYASPNKFYESLFLACPIITSKSTLVGNQVLAIDSGYVIDDSQEALAELLQSLSIEQYEIKRKNCSKNWSDKYADYAKTAMMTRYISAVSEL